MIELKPILCKVKVIADSQIAFYCVVESAVGLDSILPLD
jgi:hypothetical protein